MKRPQPIRPSNDSTAPVFVNLTARQSRTLRFISRQSPSIATLQSAHQGIIRSLLAKRPALIQTFPGDDRLYVTVHGESALGTYRDATLVTRKHSDSLTDSVRNLLRLVRVRHSQAARGPAVRRRRSRVRTSGSRSS